MAGGTNIRPVVIVVAAVVLASVGSCYVTATFPAGSKTYPDAPDRCAGNRTYGIDGMVTFDNRSYCDRAISVDETTSISSGMDRYGNTTSESFLGFSFSITPWLYDMAGFGLNTTVAEPTGGVFQGGPYWTEVRGGYSDSWFTPDNESGVYAVAGPGQVPPPYPLATVLLLVEAGA